MEFSKCENKLKNPSHYSAILSLLWIKFVSNFFFFLAILENQSMLVKLEAN